MLADNFILNLDYIELKNKNLLPDCSCIYYVIDEQQIVWYIGRSINLRKRWNGEKPHHRYNQLISISAKENQKFLIYYFEIKKNQLYKLEKIAIAKYQPRLNHTPVIKHGYLTRKVRQTNVHINNCSHTVNTSLKIFSDVKQYKTQYSQKKMNNIKTVTNGSQNNNLSSKQFNHKFINLKNPEIGLNWELEVCIDSRDKLYIRHHTLFIIYYDRIDANDLKSKDEVENCLSILESRCQNLYKQSLRWLGYKLSCEKILLIDEEEQFEIETPAIMLPWRMFVELVEYQWATRSDMSKIIGENELEWFKNQSLSVKIAKYLDENDLTLYKLIEQIN